MLLLARSPRRLASRLSVAAAAYWGANVALAAIEVRWHPITRLLLWDISRFKVLLPALAHIVHLGS